MNSDSNPYAQDLAGDVAAALAWWSEAGVDQAFVDVPQLWAATGETASAVVGPQSADAPPPPPAAASAAPPPVVSAPRAAIGGARESWPATLDEFAPWWLGEPTLSEAPARLRVPPRGPAGAALMVLVPQPEEHDSETLLTGPHGALLGAMLAAMGIAEDDAYVASALPARAVDADWAELAGRGLGAVVAHHVGLVAPRRLMLLSRNLSPLLGHNPAQNSVFLPFINHEGANLPILAALDLASLHDRGGARAGFWQQWLDWTASF